MVSPPPVAGCIYHGAKALESTVYPNIFRNRSPDARGSMSRYNILMLYMIFIDSFPVAQNLLVKRLRNEKVLIIQRRCLAISNYHPCS